MFSGTLLVWLCLKIVLLLLTFFGIGMYLRGFWIYFDVRRWLWAPSREMVRRRYRSSVIAAVLRDPELLAAKRQIFLAVAGLPLFVIGCMALDALGKPF